MLQPDNLILASRSPRRIHLLRQIGLHPHVIPCEIDETIDPARSIEQNAMDLAAQKARAVAGKIRKGIVLGADTIVMVDETPLGKPSDEADAIRMLSLLSGRTHTVVTGFALHELPSGREVMGTESTRVTFRQLPIQEIEEYVAGGSPLDKAGAYGIQDDYGAVFVTRIEGCYYNVVGLPLARVYAALGELIGANGSSTRR
jgi:septum formation protein